MTCWGKMYLLLRRKKVGFFCVFFFSFFYFFFKLEPWRIKNKGKQKECINGPKPFLYLTCHIISLLPLEWGKMKSKKLLCCSPRKDPTAHHCAQRQQCLLQGRTWAHRRSSAPQQSPPAAHRSELWQHPNSKWMALLLHASELTLGRGSNRRTTIASGKQSSPSQTSLDTPYSPVMVWREDFFPCTHRSLCSNKFGTFLPHSAPESARNLQSKLRFLAVLQRYQGFTGSGVHKTTTAREALHGANNLDHLMIVYCAELQYTHIFIHFTTHFIRQTLCKKTDTCPTTQIPPWNSQAAAHCPAIPSLFMSHLIQTLKMACS